MNYTLTEVCEFLNEQCDFSKTTADFKDKATKAAVQLGFKTEVHQNRVHVKTPTHTIIYRKIATPTDLNMQALLLTHAILKHPLHES